MTLLPERILPTKTYPFGDIRHLLASVVEQEGIVHKGDFAVTQRAAGANLSVDVAAGAAYVQGDDVSRQGVYEVINDANVNVLVPANSSGNPRIDTIVLQVNDSSVASLTDDPAIVCIPGTPTPSATLANLLGKAAMPNTALLLAYVLVANGAGSILNANAGGLYDPKRATIGAVGGAPPQYAFGRPADYTPHASIWGGAQSPANGAAANVAMTTVRTDNDSMYVGYVANALVCQTPGIYQLGGRLAWTSNAGGTERVLFMRLNGGAELADDDRSPGTGARRMGVSRAYRLGFTDYVQLFAYQDSGGALALETTTIPPELTATFLGV